jgi:TRAP-type mannitol/chloroaromatic compound transport system substrate-binding protein
VLDLGSKLGKEIESAGSIGIQETGWARKETEQRELGLKITGFGGPLMSVRRAGFW